MRIRLLFLAAVLAFTGCANQAEPTSDGFVAGDGSFVVLDPTERQPAPQVTGSTLDGGTFTLADYAGDVVLLNVWASWCAPCRAEAPILERVWRDVQDEGVQFVGLDTRDSDAAAQAFVNRFGLTYPNVVDRDGRLQLLFGDTLPPQAIPSTLLIDRQGRVAARALGKVSESTLRGLLEPLIAEPR
jgi:peroxiredoxin